MLILFKVLVKWKTCVILKICRANVNALIHVHVSFSSDQDTEICPENELFPLDQDLMID